MSKYQARPHFEICHKDGFLSWKLRAVCHLQRLDILLVGRVFTGNSAKNVSTRRKAIVSPGGAAVGTPNQEQVRAREILRDNLVGSLLE
jgi:hypothetical protein